MMTPKYRILWTWDFATCRDDSYFGRAKGVCLKTANPNFSEELFYTQPSIRFMEETASQIAGKR